MFTALALAALLTTGPAPSPDLAEPVMRVVIRDLDFRRDADIDQFVARLDDASRRFCAAHRALVTPIHATDPRFCEHAMRSLAVGELNGADWRRLVRSGRMRAINRG